MDTPPNTNITHMLAIKKSGANTYLAIQATHTMAPIIMENETKERLPDGSTMESTNISTLQLPGLIKQAIQIHILPKMNIAPLISLGVICDYECTVTLEKKCPSRRMDNK